MKKIFFILATLTVAFGCEKATVDTVENTIPEQTPASEQGPASLRGIIEMTKTAYANETEFSWLANDPIAVQLIGVASDNSGKSDQWSYYASTSGKDVTFTPTSSFSTDKWKAGNFAYYPNYPDYVQQDKAYSSESRLDIYFADMPYAADPMSLIPMIGTKKDEAELAYSFVPATGVLKVQLANLPSYAASISLTTPTGSGAYLNGYFTIEDRAIKMSKADASYSVLTKKVAIKPASDGTYTAYIPVPVGTLPANSVLTILDGDGAGLVATKTKSDLAINQGDLVELKPLTLPNIAKPANLVGTYNGTARNEHAGINNDPISLTLVASDNASYDVILTEIGGVTATEKVYGTVTATGKNTGTITFAPCIFATYPTDGDGYDRYSLQGLNYPTYYWGNIIFRYTIAGNTITLANPTYESTTSNDSYWVVLRRTNETKFANGYDGAPSPYGYDWRAISVSKTN